MGLAVTPESVIQGRVVTVVDRIPGSTLAVDAAAGAGVLELDDLYDFAEEGGSATLTDGETTEVVAYTAVDDDTATLTLSGVTVNPFAAGETYVQADPSGVEKSAYLIRDDVDDEQIVARVPHRWYDVLPEGIRDPGESEAVTARFDGTEWVIEDILGQTPTSDGSYIDPATLPPPPVSDGLPPSASPAPTVTGGIAALFVEWTAITNADPVTYEVHVSTTTGFTPGPTTFSQATDGTQAVIEHLPDLTPLDPTGATTYYVKVVSVDEDGSATASAQGSGFPRQVTGPDIAVEAVTAREILAGSVTADRLSAVLLLANLIQTATEGQRVEIGPGGIRLYSPAGDELVALPTDPGASPTFRGDVVTGGLQVLGNALIQGADNLMDKGSVLTLAAKTSDPGTAPTIGFEYDSDPLPSPIPDMAQTVGLDFDTNGNATTTDTLLMLGYGDGNIHLFEVSAARPVTLLRSAVLFPASNVHNGVDVYGVARLGAYIWVLYKSSVGSNFVVRAFDASTLAGASTTTISIPGDTSQGVGFGTDGTHLLVLLWTSSSGGADKRLYLVNVSGSAILSIDTAQTLTGGATRTTTSGLGGITGRDGTHYTTVTKKQSAGKNYSIFENFLQSTKALDTAGGSVWTPDSVTLASNDFSQLWKGVAYDGSQYLGVGVFSAILQRYSSWVWTPGASDDKWWIGYTWAAAAPFESAVSPRTSLVLNGAAGGIGRIGLAGQIAMRGQLRITTPPLPEDATTSNVYEVPSSTAPATTAMKKQTPFSSSLTPSGDTFILHAYASGGAAPDTAHPFPDATSNIKGDDGAGVTEPWNLGGDGSLLLTRSTVAQRPASPIEGDYRYNEDRSVPEYYDGSVWRTGGEIVTVSVNVPSTNAHTSGSVTPTIPGLNVGDLCFWVGVADNEGIQFHFRTIPLCGTSGQITLWFFNASDTTRDPNPADHYFMIARRT